MPRPKVQDQAPIVKQDDSEILRVAKVVLAQSLNQKGENTTKGIAKAAGMTVEAVELVLDSECYRQALNAEARRLISHSVTRGVAAMDRIIGDSESTDANKISAFRTVVQTYEAMQAALNGKANDQPLTELQQWLEQKARELPKITVSEPTTTEPKSEEEPDASPGRTRPDPQAEKPQGYRRDPAA